MILTQVLKWLYDIIKFIEFKAVFFADIRKILTFL